MKLIFKFKLKIPASFAAVTLLAPLITALTVFPAARTPVPQTFEYLDESFRLFISPSKVLFLYGPWGTDAVIVDRDVGIARGTASAAGVGIVYQRRDKLSWAVFSREEGKKLNSGRLKTLVAEDGDIRYTVITAQDKSFTAKVVFDTGDFSVYRFDQYGRWKLVRQGRLPGSGNP